MDKPRNSVNIDAGMKASVVEDINKLLMDQYISLDTAQKLAAYLLQRLAGGGYDQMNDPEAFASALTEDLRRVSQDNHFYVAYNPAQADLVKAKESLSDQEREEAGKKEKETDRLINFGFTKLERLPGNIGLLELSFFCNPEHAGETAVAAMAFLANTDAVIIDLRNNHGGWPSMVQLLCSYFIKGGREGRTHLNSFERRYDNSLEQYWTMAYVPGQRMYEKDLYILTSKQTASGAEEFTYNMKNLKRATIIGETSRGAAHPIDQKIVQNNFIINLPIGRPVNPISKTNWEKTGINAEIAVPADQALEKAHLMALMRLLPKAGEEQKYHLNWAIDGLKAQFEPVKVDKSILKKYAGDYGERKIRLKNGELFYQRTGPSYKLVPMTKTIFAVEGLPSFRIEFIADSDGPANQLVGLYDDGLKDPSRRTR